MTNALLLRLFTSEFFNSWIAVSYLFRYSDNVGIQHYLCTELKKFPTSEIEFFLPQLIHLLITRPSDSVALEYFLVEMCEKSTHMALMTHWYLQAYLSDLSVNRNSSSFELCKKLLNKSQAIVFSSGDNEPVRKVKENAIPALVGMGALLLGIGQPHMTKTVGRIAITQGRRNRTMSITSQKEALLNKTAANDEARVWTRRNTVHVTTPTLVSQEEEYKKKKSSSSEIIVHSKRHSHFITTKPVSTLYSPSLEDLHRGKAFSMSQYIKNAQQKINLKITRYQQTEDDPFNETKQHPASSLSNHLSIYDPNLTALGQSSVPTNTPHSPALCSKRKTHSKLTSSFDSTPVSLTSSSSSSLASLDDDSDKSIKNPTLLRSNYIRSEMQFLLALVDIATRLVMVPKEARMSALQAELTLLNHNLPAEICLPLWCPATSEKPFHHRIVRISPADAVVLNSAERAPYLLMIEVLDDEMHFDKSQNDIPTKKVLMTPLEDDISDCYHEKTILKKTDDYAERMRTAAVMLAQLQQGATHTANHFMKIQETETIRQRIIKEMMALEEQRMLNMKIEGGVGLIHHDIVQDEQRIAMVVNKEDPSAAVLSEDWETKKARLRAESPYGHLPNWRLLSVIVKNGADLRQEQFAGQLIREMQLIWADTGVDVWVKYFRILVTSDSSGLMETLKNTISIHSIKKNAYTRGWNQKDTLFTLYDYFKKIWGPPDSEEFLKAQDAFMRSLAGYSVACYVLQIKDRHNGNLLIDELGHLIHIDFGFMLSNSPGSVGFEMAPFKLPQEYIDILGGINGEKFAEYKALMKAAFLAVRKHSENILLLTEMMSINSKLPCFQNGEMTVAQLRDRFQLHLTEPQAEEFVDKLIMSSCCNVFTRLYDTFQYYSQGIL